MIALVWFYWPITLALTAGFLAAHLYFTATRHDRSSGAAGSVASLGALSVGVPAIPLAVGLSPGCSDTGTATFFEPSWIMVGIAVVLWGVAIALLYCTAGSRLDASGCWALGIVIIAGVMAAMEYGISRTTLAMYCNDTIKAALGVQVVVAVVGGASVATVVTWSMRRRPWTTR